MLSLSIIHIQMQESDNTVHLFFSNIVTDSFKELTLIYNFDFMNLCEIIKIITSQKFQQKIIYL